MSFAPSVLWLDILRAASDSKHSRQAPESIGCRVDMSHGLVQDSFAWGRVRRRSEWSAAPWSEPDDR
jgi:hypothetical protein